DKRRGHPHSACSTIFFSIFTIIITTRWSDKPFSLDQSKKVAYARVVRKGAFVAVSGTTSTDWESGELLFPGDAYLQAKQVLEILSAH
ncbi:hypothetical protein BC829DRAFT_431926, partial [Chytridium lagenaria]